LSRIRPSKDRPRPAARLKGIATQRSAVPAAVKDKPVDDVDVKADMRNVLAARP
jgi:hypothetical protein